MSDDTEQTMDFRSDPPEEMTWGRRIALALMSQSWYNPLANVEDDEEDNEDENDTSVDPTSFETGKEKPDLSRAWAYFEHVALDRYIVTEDDIGPPKGIFDYIGRLFSSEEQQLKRADPGAHDTKTRLYDPILTPHSQVCQSGHAILNMKLFQHSNN
jgi:hypothetical protein